MQMNEFGSFFLILFLFVLPFVLADLQVDFYKSGTDPGFRDGGPEDKKKKKKKKIQICIHIVLINYKSRQIPKNHYFLIY